MKKILFSLCLILMMVSPIFGAENNIIDNANILTDDEEVLLESKINDLSYKHQIDFIIYTDDEYTDSIKMEAADIYDSSNFNNEGVMLYINMANREYFILTTGSNTIYRLSDYGLDEIKTDVASNLSSMNYLDASLAYLEGVDSLFDYYYENNEVYDINSGLSKNERLKTSLYFGLFGSIIITAVVAFVLTRQLKSVIKQNNASDYSVNDYGLYTKANITRSRDMFLYRTLTRTRIQRNTTSGGSSTFSGSSGTTHGGRGGSF